MIVAGNWKMHGDKSFAQSLLQALAAASQDLLPVSLWVFPPAIWLPLAQTYLQDSAVSWGAQNLYFESEGAFTGEICASMLKSVQASCVLVGHSERRQLFAETDAVVAKKYQAAISAGLRPVLCVGESQCEREAGQTESVICRQLDAVLSQVGIAGFSHAAVAYEPVWAIGTGCSAKPADAQAVHAWIRSHLAKHDHHIAASLPILYGGSVKPDNAADLFAMPDIQGGLIGGASLNVQDFVAIAMAAKESQSIQE